MFRDAVRIAGSFTKPVVLSTRTVGGKCDAGCGSYTILNSDGWALTAFHIVQQVLTGAEEMRLVREYHSARKSIETNPAMNEKERRNEMRRLKGPEKKTTRNFSAWWGADALVLDQWHAVPALDLGVIHLAGFDPSSIASYPKLKDPAKGLPSGASVCRIGYPFVEVETSWDDTSEAFALGPKTQLSLFPIEGMVTRTMNVLLDTPISIPAQLIETSSPGLRGQSGGPIFDAHGAIWAIQTQTRHLPLGFDPVVPGSQGTRREHQFLNVGMGVSVATIVPFLQDLGISFELAPY